MIPEAFATDWEKPFHEANRLIGQGFFDQACSLLRSSRDEALAEGLKKQAAFYSNILGSFLLSRDNRSEALEAYLQAEQLDPSEPQWKLSLADFFFGGGDADAALAKAKEALLAARDQGDTETRLAVEDLMKRMP